MYPAFSVAMSVYKNDKPENFEIAIKSIWNQTVRPNEIVLVVDGWVPTEIDEVISAMLLQEIPLEIIRLETNMGLGNALRIATEKCKNELIARMDSDDIAVPDRFERLLDMYRKNPELSVVGGNILEFIDGSNRETGFRVVPETDEDIKQYLKKRCPFNHMTVMYRRDAVLSVGNYEHFPWNEDYYLWIKLYEKGACFANTGTVLVHARIDEAMYRRRGGFQYFKSEFALQKYMLRKKIISLDLFICNVMKRFIVQVVLPNRIRGIVFQMFARKKQISEKC